MLDTQILRLPVEAITPNPYQPRTDFAPEPLAELAAPSAGTGSSSP